MKKAIQQILFAVLFSAVAFGAPKAVTGQSIQRMVSDYYATTPKRSELRPSFVINFSGQGSCVEEACSKIDCGFASDAEEMARACAGNYGGGCLRVACNKVGCNFKSDVVDFAVACRQNFGGDCLKTACDHVSCNFKSEVVEFANACQGADGDCVRSVCDRTGCAFRSDVMNVIKACSGN